jgi:hypothetical protein
VRTDRAQTPAVSWESESRQRLPPYDRWSSGALATAVSAETPAFHGNASAKAEADVPCR